MRLGLQGNVFSGARGHRLLFEGLRANRRLEWLDLSFGSAGLWSGGVLADAVGPALAANRSLTLLDLSHCTEGLPAASWKGAERARQARTCPLGGTRIAD